MNKYFPPIFSGFTLKLISFLLFVVGRVLLELDFDQAGTMYKVGNGMIYVSLPILCFLAIEGYRHTGSVRKYAIRLGAVGVASELIIDLSLFNMDFNRYLTGNNLNICISLLLGVLMIWALEKGRHFLKGSLVLRNLFTIMVIIVFVILGILVGAEFCGGILFTMAAMYLFYGNPFAILIAVAAIQVVVLGTAAWMVMYAPVIGVICTWFYNGKRGYKSIASVAFFYSIYPITYSIVAMLIKNSL